MNKKTLSLVMAGVLSASAVLPAFASGGSVVPVASGTEVWAGVVLEDPDAKVKVEVPTLFAFVVNGSVSAAETGAVTSANGGILLPNVKVDVTTPSEIVSTPLGGGAYTLNVVSDGIMRFTNYSTWKNPNDTATPRQGMKVKINGNIKNDGTALSRNNWEYVPAIGSADPLEFKKYVISIDGDHLDQFVNGGYQMAVAIDLDAPDLDLGGAADSAANLNTVTNLAISGETKTVVFDVEVGGQKNQYKQVEESAKVGTIVWTVTSDVIKGDFYTAPDNEYMDGLDSQNGVDPDTIPTS